ncbi:hypothetical protein CRENBAI_001116 [Crenichthys baileyi]|uniref:Uncharacterized protein n=1 Tax=Crenichthys baileyi TaxID=28760 RepID=A0AAV9RAC3_9TELE
MINSDTCRMSAHFLLHFPTRTAGTFLNVIKFFMFWVKYFLPSEIFYIHSSNENQTQQKGLRRRNENPAEINFLGIVPVQQRPLHMTALTAALNDPNVKDLPLLLPI